MKHRYFFTCLTGLLLSAGLARAQESSNLTLMGQGSDRGYSNVAMTAETAAVARLNAVTLYGISDIQNPVRLASIPFAETVYSLALSGDYMFVLTNRLEFFDISEPGDPKLLASTTWSSTLPFQGYCALTVTEQTIFLAVDRSVMAFDWADRATLRLISSVSTPLMTDMVVAGSVGFLACQLNGVVTLDLTDLTTPRIIGTCVTGGFANGLALRGNYLYLADGNVSTAAKGLRIFDISAPDSLKQIAFLPTAGDAWMVTLNGDYAYLCDRPGIRILNIADPLHPSELSLYSSQGRWYNRMHVAGSKAVSDYQSGAAFFDISDPAQLTLMATLGGSGVSTGTAVAYSGQYAFLADRENGLRIVDCSDPVNPFDRYDYDTPGTAFWVAIAGTTAYIADGTAGLRAVDISDLQAVTEKGVFDSPGSCEKVLISGDKAFVADGTSGLRIIDIQNPVQMNEVGFFDSPARVTGCALSGNLALITDYTKGIRLLDISNLATIVEVGYYDTPGTAWDAVLSGSLAYVADGGKGLRILDISNPQAITEIGAYDTNLGNSTHLILDAPLLYLADGENGVRVLDVSNPAAPVEVAWFNTPGSASGLAKEGELVLVADGSGSGLKILRNDYKTGIEEVNSHQPATISLFQNYPNPFNSTTNISFSLERSGPVKLEIYDLLGRKVITLLDAVRQPGVQHCRWNGSGLPSGIYYYRLTAHGLVQQRPLVLLR